MRPFLLLSSRAEDVAADDEYEAFLRVTGLDPARLHRVRMEAAPLPALELDDYAGIFVGIMSAGNVAVTALRNGIR